MSIASTPPPRRSAARAPLAHARHPSAAAAASTVPRPASPGAQRRPRCPPVVSAGAGSCPTLHGTVDYANFDHAASTPALVSVKQAVDTALRTYSSVHRGNGYASRVTSAWYEQAREEVRAVRRRPRGRRGRLHPQQHRLVQPAGPRASPATPRSSSSRPSTTRPCCRGPPAAPHRLPVPGSVRDAQAVLLRAALREQPRPPPPRRPGRRLQRHRRDLADPRAGRHRPQGRRPRRPRRRAVRPAPPGRPRRPRRRLRRAVRAQALRARSAPACWPVARDWLDAAAPYLAGGGATKAGHRARRRVAGGRRPPRGAAAPTSSAPSPSPPPATRCARTPRPSRPTRPPWARPCSTGLRAIDGVRDLLAVRPRPRAGGRGDLHHRGRRLARSSRPPCPPSTASGSGTASSAPTCASTPCLDDPYAAGPGDRGPRQCRAGHHGRARRAAARRGRRPRRARPARRVRAHRRRAGCRSSDTARPRPRPPLVAGHRVHTDVPAGRSGLDDHRDDHRAAADLAADPAADRRGA